MFKLYTVMFAVVLRSVLAFAASDPVENLKSFSAFSSVDLQRLFDGEILGSRGSPMDFPEGICAQTCFVVPVDAAEAAQRLQVWDPSPHEVLKVLQFNPVEVPCATTDFQGISLKSSHDALRWLLGKSLATTADKSELNLTHDEAGQLAGLARDHADPQTVAAYWAKLLQERTTAFQLRGFAGVAPYEAHGATISPAKQLQAMLREKLSVAREFAPLLEQSGVLGGPPAASLTPFHYWGLYDANHRGALNLGAVYLLPLEDRYLLLDAQYYVSGMYNALVTLYEVWPIRVGHKTAALVWRGDFFAAPPLAFAKGADRLVYGTFMLQQLRTAVRCFQDDVKARLEPAVAARTSR